ncbi:MAG: ABC-F family ATP-binding cassette domain-containing protein [Lachnospiraceae bacterium]|nr:ABC-F family ATP-binding cassette domain-containing protein [Lachnospiraceae bacterium]
MILNVSGISKSFVEERILQCVSFHVEDYEKAAIVGINGAGKTTLLRIIVGEMAPDEGLVTISKGKTLGYLKQNDAVNSDNTIYDELLSVKKDLTDMEKQLREYEGLMNTLTGSELDALMDKYTKLSNSFDLAGGYIYRSEIVGVLLGLGFTKDEFDKKVNTLSGGQKTRVALGKLLLSKPDLIILDEPTNHLDMNSIAWLENYLLNYNGAVLVVSHDRYFLDKIATKVIEIDATRATVFMGNYSDYAVKKEALRNERLKAYLNQQREIAHQEAVIEKLRSFNREKSIKRAESRVKMLDKLERLEKPTEIDADMKLTLIPRVLSGNDVLSVRGISKSFGDNHLFSDVSFEIKRGEHVALIGDNGTGKTTILKIINGLLEADSGKIVLGSNVEVGYYDQEHHVLHDDSTLFEEISNEYPELNNTEIRNTLAAFLFTGDDVYKRIKEISGGEKGRVSLAKLMLSNSNFLILDEPTNHLDIQSKEILEDALNDYLGTVFYVSHDRYFINRTADRIIELKNNGLKEYLGNYDYYLEKREDTPLVKTTESTSQASASDNAGKLDYQAQKAEAARKRKIENDLKKCEAEIASLEDKKAVLEEKMNDVSIATNSVKLQEVVKELTEISDKLDLLYEEWENLASLD